MRPRIAHLLAFATSAAAAACDLQTVAIADPQDIVVAEIVLRAGASRQLALLHRTLGTGASADALGAVDDAVVDVFDAAGNRLGLTLTQDTACLIIGASEAASPHGSCYSGQAGTGFVLPGATYSLRIRLSDGGEMAGSTTVPGDFSIVRPAPVSCALPADTVFDVVWKPSSAAWVYIVESSLRGIRAALAERDVRLDEDPLRMIGLAISNTDTTIAFPAEFGLFDRADPDVADALIAISKGLPPNVIADVIVAAADRNYVNWVRGGNFNPSGLVRVPSIHGDGTGVFSSIVPRSRQLRTRTNEGRPAC